MNGGIIVLGCFTVSDILYLHSENVWNHYQAKDMRIGIQEKGDIEKGDIVSDIASSFLVVIGIFFPSVTGQSRDSVIQECKQR